MSLGYTNIDVLEDLVGQPWDDVARAYVHALRPSGVRIATGALKSDTKLWRVTVMIDRDDRITGITQEVEVALPPGINNGYELRCELDKRLKEAR